MFEDLPPARSAELVDGEVRVNRVALPWDQVYGVDWAEDGAYIATSRGVASATAADGAAIEARLAPWEAERTAWVDDQRPGARRRWLGPGGGRGAVTVRGWRQYALRAATLALVLAAVYGLVVAALRADREQMKTWLAVFAIAIPLGLFDRNSRLGSLNEVWDARSVHQAERVQLAMERSMNSLYGWWLRVRQPSPPRLRADLTGLRWAGDVAAPVRWEQVRAVLTRRQPLMVGEAPAAAIVLQTTAGRRYLRRDAAGLGGLERGLLAFTAQRAAAAPMDPARGWFAPDVTRVGCGLWVGPDELVQVERDAAIRLPWRELRRVEPQAEGALLHFGRVVDLSAYASPDLVADVAERHLSGAPAGDADEDRLAPELVEHWLGVKPYGSIKVTTVPSALLVVGASLCLAFAGIAAQLSSVPMAWVATAALGVSLLAAFMTVTTIRGDRYGLTRRAPLQREQIAWADVRDIDDHGRVTHRSGRLGLRALGQPNALEGAVRRVLHHRAQGRLVPRTRPLADAALSPAAAPAPAQERDRGLSLADEATVEVRRG